METIQKKVKKLIENGEQFLWEECSHISHQERFGDEPSPEWILWVSRIKNILTETVKTNSEPFIYFNEAYNTPIKGYYQDKFDFAKMSPTPPPCLV